MAGPDIKNIDAPANRIPDKETLATEPDTRNLDELLDSLNGSAERFQTLWFSFLGLTLYLAIAALATTHRNLLLGEPQTLPILNIKVELLPFYVIAPLLYLVFHFYLLVMLTLLARTAAEFDKQLRTTLPNEADRERYRARVENALFLQLLVGMKGERSGFNAFLLALVAFITIALAPLATLVLMQMMFLPYHHLRITWWHRGIVVADLVLIVVMTCRCFFPRGVRKAPLVLGALSRKPRWVAAMAFCVLLAIVLAPLVDWLSLQQGRWAGEPRLSFSEWRWWRGEPPSFAKSDPNYDATANGVVFDLFPDRLKLNDETIVGEAKLQEIKKEIASRGGDFVPTIKLDGRDLQAADLSGADLRGVSLDAAVMNVANLSFARLDGARLGCEQQVCARIQAASLDSAQLQGADLGGAQLQGTDLGNALLQGANLLGAQLQGANLGDAQLQGVDLGYALLYGSNLVGAQLQGASLDLAQLQGADLSHALLQGVDFRRAQLQGAVLTGAELADAEFAAAFVFRTDTTDAKLSNSAIWSVHADQVKPKLERPYLSALSHKFVRPDAVERLLPADVDRWKATAMEFANPTEVELCLPSSSRNPDAAKPDQTDPASTNDNCEKVSDTTNILNRFDRLKPDFQTDEQDKTDLSNWTQFVKQSLARDSDGANHRRRLATILGDLACDSAGAPYIARRLVLPSFDAARLPALGDELGVVRARMKEGRKTPEKCPGVVGFTENDWLRLEAINPANFALADH